MAVLGTRILEIYQNAINLRDVRSILDKTLIKSEEQKVLYIYKLVLVTDPLDHSERIYSLSNF